MKKEVRVNTKGERIAPLPTVANEAFAEIIKGLYEGRPLLGPSGVLTNLVKELTQVALQAEMESHLEEDNLEEGGNHRNGVTTKRESPKFCGNSKRGIKFYPQI